MRQVPLQGTGHRVLPQFTKFSCTVIGLPAPQGSKRHVGRGIMVESSKLVKPWREAVVYAAREATGHGATEPLDGPLDVSLIFSLPRPKSAPKAVTRPWRKPDLDKIVRSTLDALTTAGVFVDDSRVCDLHAYKVFAGSDNPKALDVPGCVIEIWKAGA